ncbi:MAG: SpoIIE family protein phosphatase [Anaerolineales bacterium]|jgi:serine phosphatase RsbU (regulator of sigma subunit)|nr:SpoIIE family protein phosphatase [Anaerolineales bacterium]
MTPKVQKIVQDFQAQAELAAAQGAWKEAAEFYAQCVEQHKAELALINSVQQGLSARLDMQGIYDLVGDSLRDTFNAQVVMISQYDPVTDKVFHHYAIERGQHLHIQGWHPIDSSRKRIIQTRRPYMINLAEILQVVSAGTMQVVPGTELPKSWLGVPMLVGSEARGVVSLQNLDKENAFSKSDIDLLNTLTNSLSLSLENARLFSETERLLSLLESEMEIARQTQRSILPRRMPRCAGYDFSALIDPARAVGGDFYDFIRLDKHRLSLLIGDVSDKGLPASLFMALTFSLLQAETERTHDPRQILLNVNRHLVKMNVSGMFVTLLYGILDCQRGSFLYARAGHLPPMVLDADGEVVPITVGMGQTLGVFSEVHLDVNEVTIPPGGLLCLFSDGLNEAVDAQRQQFGFERIRQELSAHRNESARLICKHMWEAVAAHAGAEPNQDDLALLVVKRLAS